MLAEEDGDTRGKRVEHAVEVGEAGLGDEQKEHAVDVLHALLVELEADEDDTQEEADEQRLNEMHLGLGRVAIRGQKGAPHQPLELRQPARFVP